MKKINYLFNVSSEYNGDFGFSEDEILSSVPKILDILLGLAEIKENGCFSPFDFKELSFDILFVQDDKIHEINREYRGKDKVTDVITFALFADDDFKMVLEDSIYLGEILISVDTAKAQAKKGIKNEILTLITHGILHLFGFDHQTDEDYNFVVGVQNLVMDKINTKNG